MTTNDEGVGSRTSPLKVMAALANAIVLAPPQTVLGFHDQSVLAACRTHEINGQLLKQMESTGTFSATIFSLLAISILLFHFSVKSDRLLDDRFHETDQLQL
jgi:hypothetical protein